jgi:glutathione S-transferase
MRLVGMLDSPFVRRTAISMEALGVPFRHEPVSVFSTIEKFRAINPVIKAPTLVCDDGEVLMESSLILQFVESTHAGSLWPADAMERQHDFRAVSLALAACDKSVQIVYERNLRPKEVQYEPWMDRVTGQLFAAYAGLEKEVSRIDQAVRERVKDEGVVGAGREPDPERTHHEAPVAIRATPGSADHSRTA